MNPSMFAPLGNQVVNEVHNAVKSVAGDPELKPFFDCELNSADHLMLIIKPALRSRVHDIILEEVVFDVHQDAITEMFLPNRKLGPARTNTSSNDHRTPIEQWLTETSRELASTIFKERESK